MIGHYQRKWSASAQWCERLAALCLPYFAIAILLHRTDQITTPQAYWLVGFGLLIVVASLLLAFRAFFELWNAGRRGGKATLRGGLLSLALLAPFLWYVYLGLTRPPVSDVSTNPLSPPQFMEAGKLREQKAADGINPLADYTPAYGELVSLAYPRLASRRYNSGAERILAATRGLFDKKGWEVVSVQNTNETGEPAVQESADQAGSTALSGARGELPGDIYLEGVSRSPVFGFRQDIVVAIISESESTLVEMRASTRWGPHDFGRNAETITDFLSDLDEALVGIAGEG